MKKEEKKQMLRISLRVLGIVVIFYLLRFLLMEEFPLLP